MGRGAMKYRNSEKSISPRRKLRVRFVECRNHMIRVFSCKTAVKRLSTEGGRPCWRGTTNFAGVNPKE